MNTFSSTYPAAALGGMKIDPLSEIRNAGIVTNGSVFWVRATGDADYVTFRDQVGRANLRNTHQAAIDLTRNDTNDYVISVPRNNGTYWDITTSVDVNKDRLHFMAAGYTSSVGTYAETIRGFSVTGTGNIDNGIFDITGHGVEIAGFNVLGTAGTSTGGTVGDATGGLVTVGTNIHSLHMHHSKISRTGVGWDNGTPSAMLYLGSASKGLTFSNMTINAGTQLAINSACVQLPFNGHDITFRDVTMITHAITTADEHVISDGGTMTGDSNLYFTMERVRFINTNAGTLPASAVSGTFPVGAVGIIQDSPATNVTQVGSATAFFISPVYGTATVIRNPYIGIGTAAIIPA